MPVVGQSRRADNDVRPSRSAALGLTAPGVELQPGSRGKPARVSNGRKYQYALPDHADEPPPTLVPPIRRLLRPQRRPGPGVSPSSKTHSFFASEIVPASHGLSASGAASRGTVSCNPTADAAPFVTTQFSLCEILSRKTRCNYRLLAGRSSRADNDVGPRRSAGLSLTAPGVEPVPRAVAAATD
jgi:hypothetical protein